MEEIPDEAVPMDAAPEQNIRKGGIIGIAGAGIAALLLMFKRKKDDDEKEKKEN